MKSQSIVSLDDTEQARCVCNRVLAQREAGINHMVAQRGRFITPTMLEQYEACFWGERGNAAQSQADPGHGTHDGAGANAECVEMTDLKQVIPVKHIL